MKKRLLSLFLAFLMVVAVVPMSVLPVFAADGEGAETETVTLTTKDYASLYVEGATALLLAYNTTGDTVVINANGKGTWADALTGTKYDLYTQTNDRVSFTGLDGKSYKTGWTKNEDGSVGYEMSYDIRKYDSTQHRLCLPATLMGAVDDENGYDATVEVIAAVNKIQINEGCVKYTDKDGSKTLTAGDLLTANREFISLRNYGMTYIQEATYAAGMTEIGTKEAYTFYNASGYWNVADALSQTLSPKSYDERPMRFIYTESDNGDGKSTLNHGFYSDADTAIGSSFTKTVTQVASKQANLTFFNSVPADAYSIRVYDRTLSTAELQQNHFADLCAFYGADISGLLALSETDRAAAIAKLATAAKDLTFKNSSKAAIDTLIDGEVAKITAQKKTRELASLYVSGASVILVAYNADQDGTVTINSSNGMGSWKNLVDGALYTLDGAKLEYKVNGEPVTTGWTVNEDGSVGYRMDFATAKGAANDYYHAHAHNLQIPVSVYEGKDSSTVEIVSKPYTLDIKDGSTYTEGQNLNVNVDHLSTRYYVAFNVFEAKYTAGLQKVGTKGIYAAYNNTAAWGGGGTAANIFDNWHASYKNAENQKALHFVVTEEPSATAGKVNFRGTFYEGMNSISLSNGNAATAPTVTATKNTVIHNNTPGAIYAVRVYTRVLNTAELQQNHFVDLCAYYDADISGLLALSETDRADVLSILATLSAGITFENSSKGEIDALIDEVLDTISVRAAAKKLASLYAEGATAIFLATESTNGTVYLNEKTGGGTWFNLVDGTAHTLTGTTDSYQNAAGGTVNLGWHFSENGGVTYDQTMQNAMQSAAANQKVHRFAIPTSYLGSGYNTTVEYVARVKPMQVSTQTIPRYTDVDKDGTLSANDTFYTVRTYMGLRNIALCMCYDGVYANGMTAVKPAISYFTYDAGRWNNANHGQAASAAQNQAGAIRRVIASETYVGGTYTAKAGFYTDGDSHNGLPTKSLTTLPTGATTMVFAENSPAEIYAIRVYARTLEDMEKLQNHFVDLVAYTGYAIDVDRFAALSEDVKNIIYTAMKDMTYANATASVIETAVEQAYLVGEAISSDGVAVNTNAESSNALRTVYNVNLASIAALEAQGATVEYGALLGVASHDGQSYLTVEDLVLGADGVIQIAVYSNAEDTDASFTYVKYDDQDEMFAQYALAVDYGDVEAACSAVEYATTFVYRGYLKVTDAEGTETVVYYADPSNRWYDGVAIDNEALVSLLPAKKAEKITSAQ